MSNLFWKCFGAFLRFCFRFRYRLEIKGLEKLNQENLNPEEGVLFLPNHTSLLEPILLLSILGPRFQMRSLIVQHMFDTFFLKPFNGICRNISIPNFETSINEYKLRKLEEALQEISEGLKKKENFLIYPSGRLKTSGKELLGSTFGVFRLLQEHPKVNVVLIRVTGLWGSKFSTAFLGRTPDPVEESKQTVKTFFKNLFFFVPRRRVVIEIEPNPTDLPRNGASNNVLNQYLEHFYNQYRDEKGQVHEIEPVQLISYSFWKKEIPEVFQEAERKNVSDIKVSDETRELIFGEIRRLLQDPNKEIKEEMSVIFDLGLDSMSIAELITFISKNFDVTRVYPEDMETVGALLAFAEKGGEGGRKKEPASSFTWPDNIGLVESIVPFGKTIPESFLHVCEYGKKSYACGDDVRGALRYDQIKKAVLVLAQYFRQFPEKSIAIMLPASLGAYISILAIEFAGKIPVMLNWTLGPYFLEEMVKKGGAETIITSSKFLDRVSNVKFGACYEKIAILEEIRDSLTLKQKLKGAFLSYCSKKTILKKMGLDKIDENETAVLLFTSGSEAIPKGVPLSHKNILSNRVLLEKVPFQKEDVIYSILPPFHSLGFTVVGLIPLLGGLKLAFFPDPTDSYGVAEAMLRWKCTVLCSPPSFLKGILQAATQEQLQYLRFLFSGGEKAPQDLIDQVKNLSLPVDLLQGYGITECAPCISLTLPETKAQGVGKPLPHVEVCLIHPETLEPLPTDQEGEFCFRGPNVFQGYLDQEKDPFVTINGLKWYRSGDLGYIDPDGNLIISGRLKRFIKIGAEMISLGAVEDTLSKNLQEQRALKKEGPSLAVCGKEIDGGKGELIVFTTRDLSREEANHILQEAGFSALVKIARVEKIEEIPIMGAGKIDYRKLQELC